GFWEISNPLTAAEKLKNYIINDGFTSDIIRGFATDKDHNLWFTSLDGIACKTRSGIFTFHSSDGLIENVIDAKPYCDDEGYIYIPFKDGFERFNPATLLAFHSSLGKVMIESLSVNQEAISGSPAYLKKLDLRYWQNN